MFANKSSKIQYRTLQTVYDVYNKSCENLFNRSDDVSIQQKQVRYLAINVYKSLTNCPR